MQSHTPYTSPTPSGDKQVFVTHLFLSCFLLSLVCLFLKVRRNAVVDIECDSDPGNRGQVKLISVPTMCPQGLDDHQLHQPALLFSSNVPREFSLRAVHLQLPSSRHLRKGFTFLDVPLLFDFVRQELAKCFVTCLKGITVITTCL